jgi:hypothetical protein
MNLSMYKPVHEPEHLHVTVYVHKHENIHGYGHEHGHENFAPSLQNLRF